MVAKLGFSEALRADMARKEMSEAALGKALGISQQAVHKWIDRGFPPLSRVNDLREMMGDGGEFAKLSHEDLFGDGQTSRTPNPNANTPENAPATLSPRSKLAVMADEVRHFAARESEQFKAHLPPALARNLETKFRPDTLGIAGRIDYASDDLVVEISHAHGAAWDQSWSAAMLRLMLYRDLVCPAARAVFLLVSEDADKPFPRLVTLAAEKYGVELVRVGSGAAAAAIIAEAEGQDLEEPDDAE